MLRLILAVPHRRKSMVEHRHNANDAQDAVLAAFTTKEAEA